MLLNVIMTSFTQRDVLHLFAKMPMSGVAASLIGGTTLHLWAGLPTRRQPSGKNWMDCLGQAIKDRICPHLLGIAWTNLGCSPSVPSHRFCEDGRWMHQFNDCFGRVE